MSRTPPRRQRLLAAILLATPLVATVPMSARALAPPPLPAGQPTPVAAPYDTSADAEAQVAQAFATARKTHRIVLLDFGANWCPDCRMLAGVMEMPEARRWIDANFVPVRIDVGRIDRNLGIARRYGAAITEIPTILEITPSGQLLDPDGTTTLGNARSMSAQADLDLIAGWGSRTPIQ